MRHILPNAHSGISFPVESRNNLRRHTVPEDGVTVYSSDPTQGPACALACAAGSVYRNYYCPRELLFDNRNIDPVPLFKSARSSLETDACEATAGAPEASEAEDMFPGQSATLQASKQDNQL